MLAFDTSVSHQLLSKRMLKRFICLFALVSLAVVIVYMTLTFVLESKRTAYVITCVFKCFVKMSGILFKDVRMLHRQVGRDLIILFFS